MFSLPDPYPDEISYSIVARFLYGWAYTGKQQLLKNIFKGTIPAFSIEVTGNPHGIIENLDQTKPTSLRDFVQRHTLLPYYFSFISRKRLHYYLRLIGDGEIYKVRRSLNLGKPNLLTPTHLRFCPDCQQNDHISHHETYWRRSHQLPGTAICPEHYCPLYKSQVPQKVCSTADYVVPHKSLCKANKFTIERGFHDFNLNLTIAKQNHALLTKPFERTLYISPSGYQKLLHENGFGTNSNRISNVAFGTSINNYFTRKKLRFIFSQFNEAFYETWWQIYHLSKRYSSPAQHLLFRHFLRETDRNQSLELEPIQYRTTSPVIYMSQFEWECGTCVEYESENDALVAGL